MSPTPLPPSPGPTLPTPSMAGIPVTTTSPTTFTASPAAPPTASQPEVGTLVAAGLLSGALFAAVLSACVAVWAARRKSREEERARQRDLFSSAYQAYAAYKEMPYAIRRRRHDDLSVERVRLSETVRTIQGQLSYFLAWTAAESSIVGHAYATLVSELRKAAGGAMRQAWIDPPIEDDAGMNIPPTLIDLSSLKAHEEAYHQAVRHHLEALAPWWAK